MITVRSQVKEIVKEAGIDNIAADFPDKLDEHVKNVILKAVERAKGNGRKTLMAKDI